MAQLLQLYYTSCRKGLAGGSGFQIYSMSSGITEDEKREVERYGLYIPPNGLPTQPTAEEVQKLFPVSFCFFRLTSGRYGVCQSRYTGQDYSGRYGNYFCHALIQSDGLFPFYPVQLYTSSIFKDRLDPQEESDRKPDLLPSLAVTDTAIDGPLTFDSVATFLGANSGLPPIEKMLSALITYPSSHRRLILCDAWENIPYWLAALQMAFPLNLAHSITFSTYSCDPEATNALICATSRFGSRFAFSAIQKDYEFYLFDFVEKAFTSPDLNFEFNRAVSLAYSLSKDHLIEFHQFLDGFDHLGIDEKLDAAYDLFHIIRLGVQDIAYERVVKAIAFANENASRQLLGDLTEGIDTILDSVRDSVDFRVAEVMVEFIFKIAEQTSDHAHRETAFKFYFNALDHFVFDYKIPDILHIESFLKIAENLNNKSRSDFLFRHIAPQRLAALTTCVAEGSNPAHACFYLSQVFKCAFEMKFDWQRFAVSKEVTGFLQGCSKIILSSQMEFSEVLAALAHDPLFFSHFCAFILENVAPENSEEHRFFLKCWIEITQKKPEQWGELIRTRLVAIGHSGFVYQGYEYEMKPLKTAKELSAFFWNSYHSVFEKSRQFGSEYLDKAITAFLDCIPSKYKHKECVKLFDIVDKIKDEFLLNRLIEHFEDGLTLKSPDGEIRSKLIVAHRIKSKCDIRTDPDMTRLLLFGISIENKGLSQFLRSDVLWKNFPDLHSLVRQQFMAYINWLIPLFLSAISNPNEHETLFRHMHVEGLEKELSEKYFLYLNKIVKADKKRALARVLLVVSCFLSWDFPSSFDSSHTLKNNIRPKLLDLLMKQTPGDLRRIDKFVSETNFSDITQSRKIWADIYSELLENKSRSESKALKSLLNNVRRFFHGFHKGD